MRLRKTKYYYTTVSYEVGDVTIEINSNQYKELREKFEAAIALNKEEYEKAKTNFKFEAWASEADFDTYSEARFYLCEGSTTYILLKMECKQGYSFGDYN